MTDERMLGTGRMNETGNTATITMPKEAVDLWNLNKNGLDVVWFTDGDRLFAVRKNAVCVSETGEEADGDD
jgi:hypothetical protein